MAQKDLLIIVISFLKIGDSEEAHRVNNVFLCFIVCFLLLLAQIKYKPYMNTDLNKFSLNTSIVILINIFLGIFSSVANDNILILILFIVLVIMNIYFVLIMLKNYLILQLILNKNFKLECLDNLVKKLRKMFEKGCYLQLLFK